MAAIQVKHAENEQLQKTKTKADSGENKTEEAFVE